MIMIFIVYCRVGNGQWISVGVRTVSVPTEGNITTVLCESTHLTSFAVLVDVSDEQQVCDKTLQLGMHFSESLLLTLYPYVS